MRRWTPPAPTPTTDARCPPCHRSYHAFRFVVEEGVPVVYGRVHDRENSPWSGDHNGRGWPVFTRRPPRLCDVPLEPRVGLRDFRDIVKRVSHFTDLWQDYLALSGGGASTPYVERLRRALRWWPRFLEGHRHTFGQDGEECTLVVDAPSAGTTAALGYMPEAGDQVYMPRVMYCRCERVVGRWKARCPSGLRRVPVVPLCMYARHRPNTWRAHGREEPDALDSRRRPLYFGHHDRTKGGGFHEEDRPFDPHKDIGKGTVVAVALHDDDAVRWGRCFDIVKVLEVMPATSEGTPLRVQYYVTCARSLRPGVPPTQSQQFEGNWVMGTRQRHGEGAFGMVDAMSAMCACWIDGPGHKPSPIHADYRLRLLEAIRVLENQEF